MNDLKDKKEKEKTMESIVEELIKRLIIEFERQDKSGVYGYTQRNLAYNSNRIEGSKLTKKQTNSLFETKSLKTDDDYVRSKDIEEMTGHFLMFNEMLKTYQQELTEDLIKNYHYQLKAGVFEDKANGYPIGEYKNRGNFVADIKTVAPEMVGDEIKKLLQEYYSIKNVSLEDIARFHYKYELIHPFQEPNGIRYFFYL